jgi:transcriptional regulator with XRE-family HTH domain
MNNDVSLEQNNLLSTFFQQTMDIYKITGKKLSEESGISENHISEFRRGKSKTGVSTKVLWQLIESMEKIAPGSRQHFCFLMAGVNGNQDHINQSSCSYSLCDLISVLEPDELAYSLSQNITLVIQAIPYLTPSQQADIMSALAQCLRTDAKTKTNIHPMIMHNYAGNNFGVFHGTFQSCSQ